MHVMLKAGGNGSWEEGLVVVRGGDICSKS